MGYVIFAITAAIVPFPVALLGFLWHIARMYFVCGIELGEAFQGFIETGIDEWGAARSAKKLKKGAA